VKEKEIIGGGNRAGKALHSPLEFLVGVICVSRTQLSTLS